MEIPISSRFHLVIDAFNCDSDKLGSKDELVKMIKDISELLNMKIISGPIVADGIEINPGLTAFAIIDFSHISIHTFTDKNEFCLDIFSCRQFDFSKLEDFIKKTFNLRKGQMFKSIVKYDEFDITYNWQNFSPKEYLNEYFDTLSNENKKILDWYREIYSNMAGSELLLEVGGGPTIYQFISAQDRVGSIYFTDYLEKHDTDYDTDVAKSFHAKHKLPFAETSFLQNFKDVKRHIEKSEKQAVRLIEKIIPYFF